MAKQPTMTAQREVTGYEIREAINRWKLRKQIAERQFRESVYAFADQEKPKPEEVAQQFKEADRNVAMLEDLRQVFNMQTKVRVGTEEMNLSLAVKLFGGSGRLEKLWRDATSEPDDRYGRYEVRTSRSSGEEQAKRQISIKDAMGKADEAARFASQLRSAISVANGNRITVPREYPANLFE